jgi:hypothetical protein
MNNLLPIQSIKIHPIAPIDSWMLFKSLIAFKILIFAKKILCITHQRLTVMLAVWARTRSCGEQAKQTGIGCALFLRLCNNQTNFSLKSCEHRKKRIMIGKKK